MDQFGPVLGGSNASLKQIKACMRAQCMCIRVRHRVRGRYRTSTASATLEKFCRPLVAGAPK
eukprot:3252276-Lingulodinium_polyedra.AAC.1